MDDGHMAAVLSDDVAAAHRANPSDVPAKKYLFISMYVFYRNVFLIYIVKDLYQFLDSWKDALKPCIFIYICTSFYAGLINM